jgi:hypothetical protein
VTAIDSDYAADLAVAAVRSRASRVWFDPVSHHVLVESLEAKFFTLPTSAPPDAQVVVGTPGWPMREVYDRSEHALAQSEQLAPAIAAVASDPEVEQVRLVWRDGRKSLDVSTTTDSPASEARCRHRFDRYVPKGCRLPAPGVLFQRGGQHAPAQPAGPLTTAYAAAVKSAHDFGRAMDRVATNDDGSAWASQPIPNGSESIPLVEPPPTEASRQRLTTALDQAAHAILNLPIEE